MSKETKLKELASSLEGETLGEAFVLTALSRYIDEVMSDDSDWGRSIITKATWQGMARLVNGIIGGEDYE